MELHVDLLVLIVLLSEYVAAIGLDPNWSTPMPLPSFYPTPTNVTFTEGELARMQCSIHNLSTKKVIWRKGSDPNPLTVGTRTFVPDKRFYVEHKPLDRNWDLLLKQVTRDDEGMYECQVSSKARHLRHNVYLRVVAREGPIQYKPNKIKPGDVPKKHNQSGLMYEIRISGEKYVEKGQKINLTCNATGESHPPDDLDWFKNGDKLSTNYRNEIFIQKRVSLTTRTIVSILEIENADMKDAGVYICRTSDLQITSARINVLNASTNNVKRHKNDKTSIKQSGVVGDSSSVHEVHFWNMFYVVFVNGVFLFINNIT